MIHRVERKDKGLVENEIVKGNPGHMIRDLCSSKVIACDTETTGFNFWEHHIVGFSFSSPTKNYYLPADAHPIKDMYNFVSLIYGAHNEKVFHNAKFDLSFIKKLGIPINGFVHDTMVMAHILNENRKSKKLKDLGAEYVDPKAKDSENELKAYFKAHECKHYGEIPVDVIGPYACKDTELTLGLYNKFWPEINSNFAPLYMVEMLLLKHLINMEMKGVKIDVKYLTDLKENYTQKLTEVGAQIYKIAGKTFNINSIDELSEVLFTQLNLPASDLSPKTGKPTVDKYTLEKLEGKHDIIAPLLEYRGLAKLTSTYIKGILDKVVEEEWIHADFQQVGTVTGRLSCWSPNLQNIPRGDEIRRAFLNPEPGKTRLLFFDYSQIEYRMAAHYSKDEMMMEGFHTDMDFHTYTAMMMFKLDYDKVTKAHRQQAKSLNFGILYGMGINTLSQKLKCTKDEAQRLLREYHDTFPRLREFIFKAKSVIKDRGYIRNFLGRRRRLSAQECYKGVNSLCQGSGADILKTAVGNVGEYLLDKAAYMIMNVHDELILVDYYEEGIIENVKRIMEDFHFVVPIKVEVEESITNWGEKKKVEVV